MSSTNRTDSTNRTGSTNRTDSTSSMNSMKSLSLGMDRREFFGRVALITGGVALTAALPWPAAPALAGRAVAAGLGSEPAPANAATASADWSIDDQWAPVPRNAEPIGYGAGRAVLANTSDGIDRGPAPVLSGVGSLDALLYS